MNRKDFIRNGMALCGLSLVPVVLSESCKKQTFSGPSNVNFTLDLSSSANAALNSVGGSMLVNGVLVIRISSSAFSALSATCTHQGCTVGYSASAAKIVCPCHGGVFNATSGAVISGPPPSALTSYKVSQSGNVLTITS